MAGAGWPPRAGRRLAWLAVIALTGLALVGLTRLRFDDDLRSLVRDARGDFRLVDEVAALFGTPDRDCIVLARARSGDLFTGPAFDELREVATALAAVEGVETVRSIFDVRRSGAAGALLPVIPRSATALDDDAREAARARALRHPLVAGHLLSADATVALLLVRLTPAADRPPRLAATVTRLEEALASRTGGSAAIDLELTGLPALREQAARALQRDMLVFNSLGLSLAVILSAVVARSLRSLVVACVPPFVGAVWALGALGLCGAPVNILTSVVPSLALVVGTCDSIHFIEDMRRSARRGIDPFAASTAAVRRVGTACGLTSLVTAVGFASLAAARVPITVIPTTPAARARASTSGRSAP